MNISCDAVLAYVGSKVELSKSLCTVFSIVAFGLSAGLVYAALTEEDYSQSFQYQYMLYAEADADIELEVKVVELAPPWERVVCMNGLSVYWEDQFPDFVFDISPFEMLITVGFPYIDDGCSLWV